MIRTPVFLGISMVSRKNRRLLVAVTYVILLALMLALVVLPWGMFTVGAWMVMTFNVVSMSVFGRLVRRTILVPRPREAVGLGLAAGHRDPDQMDEREVAVRNAAHFAAYRVLTVYCFFFYLAPPLLSLRRPAASVVVELGVMTLVAMVLTLPQAVVLWTEGDVPQEAQV